MEIKVDEIPKAGRHIVFEVGASEWELSGQGILLKEPVHVVMDVSRQGKGDVYLSGSLSTKIQMECSRCLKSIYYPIQTEFHLEYIPSPESFPGEETLSMETLDLIYYHEQLIKVDDEMIGQLILSVPMHPLCQADCQGLCPHCGKDLNRTPCHCHIEAKEPRWADLRYFTYKETNAKSKT